MKQSKRSRYWLLFGFSLSILGIIPSILITGFLKIEGELFKIEDPSCVWYWITFFSFLFSGFFLGYSMENRASAPLWGLKNEVMHLRKVIRDAVRDKKITKNESYRIKKRLIQLHEKASRESPGDSIVAFLLAPYYIIYVLLADRRITDCAFTFAITRFFRRMKGGSSLRSVRELTDDALQSLEWCRRRFGVGQVVAFAALFVGLTGIGLHQGIIDVGAFARYISFNFGMVIAMISIDHHGPN